MQDLARYFLNLLDIADYHQANRTPDRANLPKITHPVLRPLEIRRETYETNDGADENYRYGNFATPLVLNMSRGGPEDWPAATSLFQIKGCALDRALSFRPFLAQGGRSCGESTRREGQEAAHRPFRFGIEIARL